MIKTLISFCILITLQGCIKVQDTGEADLENPNKTQGVVFDKYGSVYGATKAGIQTDNNHRQSLYTTKLIGSIDQDAIVYDLKNEIVGICIGKTETAFDSEGYLIGECELPGVSTSTGDCNTTSQCSETN